MTKVRTRGHVEATDTYGVNYAGLTSPKMSENIAESRRDLVLVSSCDIGWQLFFSSSQKLFRLLTILLLFLFSGCSFKSL